MIFKQFFDPESSTFTYLLANRKGGEALIIDSVDDRIDEYLQFLGDNELKLVCTFDTHVHADHITGMDTLQSLTTCLTFIGSKNNTSVASRKLSHGDTVSIEGIELQVLATPGHTDDSYCFYMPGMVFTGDTLFIRGNGRTDFQNGDTASLYDSITKTLFGLPDNTIVYPGHDYKGETFSTIGHEKRENPRVAGKTKEDFIEIMDNLDLPNPKQMDIAVPINQRKGVKLQDEISKDHSLLPEEVHKNLKDYFLIDLRSEDEISKIGKIDNAIAIPFSNIEKDLKKSNSELVKALKGNKKVVYYCAFGERSALAIKLTLKENYSNIAHMKSGINGWNEFLKSV